MTTEDPTSSEPTVDTGTAEAPPSRWAILNRWPVQVALVALAVFAMRTYQLQDTVSGQAPAIGGRSLDGARLAPDAIRPTLVYFWATWCGVCKVVDPNVARVAEDHDVITIAVNSGSDRAVQTFLDQHDLDMPTVNDQHGRLARRWGVSAFPTSFWLDRDGTIRHREVGYTSTAGMLARLWWVD